MEQVFQKKRSSRRCRRQQLSSQTVQWAGKHVSGQNFLPPNPLLPTGEEEERQVLFRIRSNRRIIQREERCALVFLVTHVRDPSPSGREQMENTVLRWHTLFTRSIYMLHVCMLNVSCFVFPVHYPLRSVSLFLAQNVIRSLFSLRCFHFVSPTQFLVVCLLQSVNHASSTFVFVTQQRTSLQLLASTLMPTHFDSLFLLFPAVVKENSAQNVSQWMSDNKRETRTHNLLMCAS